MSETATLGAKVWSRAVEEKSNPAAAGSDGDLGVACGLNATSGWTRVSVRPENWAPGWTCRPRH